MREDKSTYEVEELLKNTEPNRLSSFFKENRRYMVDEKKAFYYYIKDVVEAKGVKLKDMYIQAGTSESYGEKIVRMESHTKNRDLIIRLCIEGRFTIYETNKALKLYGMNTLYSKEARDACIIYALYHKTYDMFKIDDMLLEQGLQKISADWFFMKIHPHYFGGDIFFVVMVFLKCHKYEFTWRNQKVIWVLQDLIIR